MFFAGTIWLVDLRMMGLAFRNMPFSKLNDRVLPITMVSFAVMVITGVITFIGRDPLLYYHDIWFRLKMIFLVIAVDQHLLVPLPGAEEPGGVGRAAAARRSR